MGRAKDIRVQSISSKDAAKLVQRLHYSGKTVSNSQLHLGVFMDGKCGGVMQFGPSMDKRKALTLVRGTKWNGFLELNRMAFADWLPPNSESRALGFALRKIRKDYPQIEWIVSYSDATQCGDGTIYRASGFVLTSIKRNSTLLRMPDGSVMARMSLDHRLGKWKAGNAAYWKRNGAKPLVGYQLRYVYFVHPEARQRLAVPILSFDEIDKRGARMYRGQRPSRVGSADSGTLPVQGRGGGASPTSTLQPCDIPERAAAATKSVLGNG